MMDSQVTCKFFVIEGGRASFNRAARMYGLGVMGETAAYCSLQSSIFAKGSQ